VLVSADRSLNLGKKIARVNLVPQSSAFLKEHLEEGSEGILELSESSLE
jgi:hypothetical protein